MSRLDIDLHDLELELDPNEARMFAAGKPVLLRVGADGSVRKIVGWRLWLHRVRAKLQDLTAWRRLRAVVVAIDRRSGRVQVGLERWSWRRWRWERVE
jgi:hypothetical protein